MKKGKTKYEPITFGHVLATWNVIYLTSLHESIKASDAVGILIRNGKLGGSFPAKKGMEVSIKYGFVEVKSGELTLPKITLETLIPICDSDDLNIEALRIILFKIIAEHNFEWLIYYDVDSEIFKTYLESYDVEWLNLLLNADLLNFDDENVNQWWREVLKKYEDYKENVKKAIGDVGEKLTYEYELNRIEADGFKPSNSFVKWASRISDRFGFDVLSIRGDSFKYHFDKKDKIQIEVKSTDASNTERFRFFVSKPEWNMALENLDSYMFFCWAGVNLNTETAEIGPYVIPAKDIISYMPEDKSETCSWSECRVVIDLSKFCVLNSA